MYHENAAELTLRQLVVRVDGIPAVDLLWGDLGWSQDAEMLALVIELLDAQRLQAAAIAGSKKAKKAAPLRMPRPDGLYPKKKVSTKDAYLSLARRLGGG